MEAGRGGKRNWDLGLKERLGLGAGEDNSEPAGWGNGLRLLGEEWKALRMVNLGRKARETDWMRSYTGVELGLEVKDLLNKKTGRRGLRSGA